MALYVTREGPVATVNSFTNLTTFGGQTLNSVTVPTGYNSIKEIWVMAIPNGAVTDTTGCAFSVRLQGSAIKNGPVTIPVGGFGSEITGNSAVSKGKMSQVLPVDIGLVGGDFWIQGAQNSAGDIGTPELAVTVVMTKAGASNKIYEFRYVSDAITVDTKYNVTGDGAGATVGNIRVPNGVSHITGIYAACGGLTLATASGGINFLRLEGTGIVEGEHAIPINGLALLSTTTGVTDAWAEATYIPTDIAVKPGGDIKLYVEHTGVAWSTAAENAVTLEMS